MMLAVMMSEDRDALTCDMAETYHIYDLESVPIRTLSVLAAGLRGNSRIRMKLAGIHEIPETVVLVRIHDILANVFAKEKKKPALLADLVTGKEQELRTNRNVTTFSTPEEFNAAFYGKKV